MKNGSLFAPEDGAFYMEQYYSFKYVVSDYRPILMKNIPDGVKTD